MTPNNPFEPDAVKNQPNSVSPTGTPMTHKETSKPIAGPIPDAENPDTNHPGVMTDIDTPSGGKVRDSSGPSAGRNDPPEDPKTANVSGEDKWAKFRTNKPDDKDPVVPTETEKLPGQEHNPNPVTAGSAEDVEKSAGKYEGDVRTGMVIKVSPLNAADDDYVVGKVSSLDVSGLGQIVYIDEQFGTKIASFHADDAEIIYETPDEKKGKRIFINDDQTYDARELKAERPHNEKQYVEKQRVLRDQTAKSQFGKSLS